MTRFGIRIVSAALVGVVLSTPSACTSSGTQPASKTPASRLNDYGLSRLPDDELRAAAPEGFTVSDIKRNSSEFAHKGWITVGVRLESSDVSFARAIYYVLPSADEARDLYQRQVEITKEEARIDRRSPRFLKGKVPKPFAVGTIARPNLCGVRVDLYWCHSYAGRLYLVVQTSATKFLGSRIMATPSTRPHAEDLFIRFAKILST